jgi:hypothetical protein
MLATVGARQQPEAGTSSQLPDWYVRPLPNSRPFKQLGALCYSSMSDAVPGLSRLRC